MVPLPSCSGCLSGSVSHSTHTLHVLLSLGPRAAGLTHPDVCAAPQLTGTHPLQFCLSAHTSCMLCLDPFIFTWLHMIKYIQDVAFIRHEIKDSSEHEETSWLHLVKEVPVCWLCNCPRCAASLPVPACQALLREAHTPLCSPTSSTVLHPLGEKIEQN